MHFFFIVLFSIRRAPETATNVAESSVTIPDVQYVIDTGIRRGIFTDERTGQPALLTRWVSRASAKQRAGRTGRLGPGARGHRRITSGKLLLLAPVASGQDSCISVPREVSFSALHQSAKCKQTNLFCIFFLSSTSSPLSLSSFLMLWLHQNVMQEFDAAEMEHAALETTVISTIRAS